MKIILACTLALGLTGCGNSGSSYNGSYIRKWEDETAVCYVYMPHAISCLPKDLSNKK